MKKITMAHMVCCCILFLGSLVWGVCTFAGTGVSVSEVKVSGKNTSNIIYISGNKNDFPIEYYDFITKEYKGAMPDLLKRISRETGIQFVYVDKSDAVEEQLKNLQVDMISDYNKSFQETGGNDLTYSPLCFELFTEEGVDEIYLAFTKVIDSQTRDSIIEELKSMNPAEKEQILLINISKGKDTYYQRFVKYALKPVSLVFGIGCLILVIIIYAYQRRIGRLVYRDALTGYGNGKKLQKDYRVLIDDENRCSYCVVNLSIENFIKIKEERGFDESHLLLIKIADVLYACLFRKEIFSRVSGDNFIMIIQYASKKKLALRLDRIYKKIRTVLLEELKCDLVIRSGVYFLTYNDRELREPIKYAVQAKRLAREEDLDYAMYDALLEEKFMGDRELEKAAEVGIDTDEFVPYFHPKIDAKTSKITGFEVLARWQNRERGLLFPSQFITILQKTGLLTKMDLKLFKAVCRLLKDREKAGKEQIYVSFNFSKESFHHPDFGKSLYYITKEQEISTDFLGIDITESVTVENKKEIVERVNQLKSYGFSITLDRFGNEYSSFVDLQKCSIDYVKLDRELIDDLGNSKTQLVIRGIVELCHSIGVKVICEGIETVEQEKLAQQVNADVIQGYLFHQPMPYSEIDKLMST